MRRSLVVLLVVSALSAPAAAGENPPGAPPAVVAVVSEAGLNPAHEEFRHLGGPLPELPPHQVVELPATTASTPFATLAAEMAAGPLGRLEPGQLYRIDGTRLLVHIPAALTEPYDLIEGPSNSDGVGHRQHGTGAVGSAIGATTGTAPNAWALLIPTGDPSGFEWLAAQDWVDVASISSYVLLQGGNTQVGDPNPRLVSCAAAPHVRAFTEDRVFFASSGNSDSSSLLLLNSAPEFYLVGGVDQRGSAVMRPRVPADADDLFWSVPYATRTFESGDRYEFQTAGANSVDGMERYGGTSGATPTTAGRAATIVMAAREILGDTGDRPGALLAAAGPDVTPPAAGPLADGSFTSAELTTLLHAVAAPALTTPGRYVVEGYGASTAATTEHALAVLRGEAEIPCRPGDDADHQRSEDARRTAFDARDCG